MPLPGPDSTPIDALPIISGFCCTAADCGNLCASFKRMRRHWSEIHGFNETALTSSSIARAVKLQTFFRGTKLRYFEVNCSSVESVTKTVPLVTTGSDATHGDEGHDPDTGTPPQVPTTCKIPLDTSLVNIDLETLMYFHHFTNTTSFTLPSVQHPESVIHYWQTDVVLQALQRRWLMCGLLAISACHLATLSEDPEIKQVHLEKSAQFFSEFSAASEEISNRDSGAGSAGTEDEAEKAGEKMRCVLRLADWVLASSPAQELIMETATLQSIMTTVRGLYPGDTKSDLDRQAITFAHTKKILQIGASSDNGSFDASSNNIPPAQLNYLRGLPSRMAEVFGKPNSVPDIIATLSALAALVECCDNSFTSDDAWPVWRSMALWLIKIPDHFSRMVSSHDPAALVVVAHWAAFLVRRVEQSGCWFFKSLTETILRGVAERLPADDSVQSLVEGLTT